jgi:hypothetical protein
VRGRRRLQARACREILLSISVLLPKLQAAKHVLPAGLEEDLGEGPMGEAHAHCEGCEE